MLFLNHAFLGGKYSGDPTIINASDLTHIRISNAVFDDIYITSDTDYDFSNLEWTLDTIFWAKFQNSLSAGNVSEHLNDVSSVLIKRRRKGKHEWLTLFNIPITQLEDLKFERFDKYVANNIEYEYALVFVLGDSIEGSYNINNIKPIFSGTYIVSKDKIFYTMMQREIQTQRNHPNNIVNTIDAKYPFVISNSMNNYTSGTLTASFAEIDMAKCDIDFEGGYDYREGLMEFLCNGQAKFLKLDDMGGRMWMIMVTGSPAENNEIGTEKYTTSFSWVEIGGIEDKYDLWENDFIDVESVRR